MVTVAISHWCLLELCPLVPLTILNSFFFPLLCVKVTGLSQIPTGKDRLLALSVAGRLWWLESDCSLAQARQRNFQHVEHTATQQMSSWNIIGTQLYIGGEIYDVTKAENDMYSMHQYSSICHNCQTNKGIIKHCTESNFLPMIKGKNRYCFHKRIDVIRFIILCSL